MLITTATVTVNAPFLQEIKDDNRSLRVLLARAQRFCASCSLDSVREFSQLLNDLRDQLAMHFALEEAYGYFDDPIDAAPNLCEQAIRLREEHSDLYLEIQEIADETEWLVYDRQVQPFALQQIVERFGEFSARFEGHESAEGELIWRACNLDIGVGD
ncbi:MAG: hemerythrin domain-containing protein [Planctomycetales bacterium]|nr:hemerythrin domain-containing protein [Planctomycetales bacterium]